jgi:hypothetical protein
MTVFMGFPKMLPSRDFQVYGFPNHIIQAVGMGLQKAAVQYKP